ncbi:MAG: YsnF/AvaK domain-containing protein [Bryobacteraceae bacterium]|nr:YsnF/AvaK domain-containing protein [Bryobacteraceae bacterium]
MADGTEFFVPSDILVPTENEGFRLTIPVSSILQGRPDSEALVADRIVPVVEERLRVETREVETGRILIHKKVESSETVVDEPLIEETYDIVRVPANRIVTAPVEPRYEGDTLILPVLEEVLVVEKRLVLREELRVTRKRREHREPQTHTVRREHLEVERVSEPITNN